MQELASFFYFRSVIPSQEASNQSVSAIDRLKQLNERINAAEMEK